MNLLSIAGSDPSTGAGIQKDIEVFTSMGTHALTVITSITSQNTSKFGKVEPISPKVVKSQIDSVFSDFKIDGIKIGMVYNSSIIKAIFSKLSKKKIPIILDPVIKSTTGGILLKKNAINDYVKYLIPLAYVITPNLYEASILSGIKIKQKQDLQKSAFKLKEIGAQNVIITGVDFDKKSISDFILEGKNKNIISSKKIKQINHGSGCTFSSALTVKIAKGHSLLESSKFAKKYTFDAIKNSKKIGKGISITKNPIMKIDKNSKILEEGIENFKKIKNIYALIPECQTNFVYSKKIVKTKNDVLGVSGRIVKAGKELVVAGTLQYGGSKHVGSALIAVNKKFPKIRSAVNIKYNSDLIYRFRKKSLVVKEYDRRREPKKIKSKENSSISWGITQAIKNSSNPPDIIYHKGDFGKEPMIMIFGIDPKNVVSKIAKVLLD